MEGEPLLGQGPFHQGDGAAEPAAGPGAVGGFPGLGDAPGPDGPFGQDGLGLGEQFGQLGPLDGQGSQLTLPGGGLPVASGGLGQAVRGGGLGSGLEPLDLPSTRASSSRSGEKRCSNRMASPAQKVR